LGGDGKNRVKNGVFGICGLGSADFQSVPGHEPSELARDNCRRSTKNWKPAVLKGKLKAIIINFHAGDKPSLDVDNMSKPILDVMQNLVYVDDRQIRQAEFTHVPIDAPFVIVGASKILVSAVQVGSEFVYVRIEDAVDPFPLPK
jgi:hypothetical protein